MNLRNVLHPVSDFASSVSGFAYAWLNGMLGLFRWTLLCTQMLMFACAEAGNEYFDVSAKPGYQQSCPLPRSINNKGGVFVAPAKGMGAEWQGVLVDHDSEVVERFEKGVFVLTKPGVDKVGFINSCIYVVSGGRRLHMRLDFGMDDNKIMSVGKSPSWRVSQGSYSPVILECTDDFRNACNFMSK